MKYKICNVKQNKNVESKLNNIYNLLYSTYFVTLKSTS